MKCNVPVAEATQGEFVLPERVQEALGQLVGAAKEGLLALSVEVGLGVLGELLEQEVEQLVGPKGKWSSDRTAVRHGHEDGEVTLGGRRVAVKRPRVRTVDGESEISLQTYEHFADRDLLGRTALERMLAGIAGGYLDGAALSRRYKTALRRAGLRQLRFHDLRHTFGTRMIAKADIRRVQGWMGHADIQTTMKYLHYAPREEDARLVAEAFCLATPGRPRPPSSRADPAEPTLTRRQAPAAPLAPFPTLGW